MAERQLRTLCSVNGKAIGTCVESRKVTNVLSSCVNDFVDFEPATDVDLPKCAFLRIDYSSYEFSAFDAHWSVIKSGNLEGRDWAGTLKPNVDAMHAMREQKHDPAKRNDFGKPRFDLIPPDALEELALVYTIGAEIYGDNNWAKGMHWLRCFGSLLRHAFAWASGEDFDNGPKGSGRHHMAHVAWNALTLVAYAKRKVGTDDRTKLQQL